MKRASRSPFALYDENSPPTARAIRFDHDAADGFIELVGLPRLLPVRSRQRDATLACTT